MDRLGVHIDREDIDVDRKVRSSKGLLSTTEVIFYLANRWIWLNASNPVDLELATRRYWCVPERELSEGPTRSK